MIDLGLAEPCLSFVNRMRSVYPKTIFTSGLRTRKDQARAMSQNLVTDRKYIDVYMHSVAIDRIREWLQNNPHVVDQAGICQGLVGVLATLSDEQFEHLTSHGRGLAVDIAPGSAPRALVIATACEFGGLVLSDLPDITVLERGKILWREGGLKRCHVQFRPLPVAPVSA